MPTDIDGILLLDKPLDLSSAGPVARVKRLFGARKAGHTGSLDPLASGMLPICFGEATKFGAQLLDADKTYRVTVRLGERTASADRESEVLESRELPDFSAAQMQDALREFPREYAQVPPMHSAIKQDGVNQVSNGIDLCKSRFFDIAAQFLFQAAEQLDSLHGVESEIEFQAVGGSQIRRSRVRIFT